MSPGLFVIIDSSESLNDIIASLRSPLIRYIHAPPTSIVSKISLFIEKFSPKADDFIDLRSDEDLYFRRPVSESPPFSILLDSCFG